MSRESTTTPMRRVLIDRLLESRGGETHWTGRLSSSALSTATAVVALRMAQAEPELVRGGLDWLVANQNDDGGWGDTVDSVSNISTTALCWGAFAQTENRATLEAVEAWLTEAAGGLEPRQISRAIAKIYGADHTFSIPILTMLALTRRLGWNGWRLVGQLPFELAALPRRWFRTMRLPVVSYALPALIAIGQVRHHLQPTRNPLTRLLRNLARRRTLRVLAQIQPEGGGFLEATPLTSFVVMSLVGADQAGSSVVENGLGFLARSVRDDGSWPIDTNLTTWVTTLSVKALARCPEFAELLPAEEREGIRNWLLWQQYRKEHPYTLAAPGGWAWTDLPGGVPDADDTAGALLALHHLGPVDDDLRDAAREGVGWLCGLQNRDGGIPTFCRGWGTLPFDRSSPDLTAHALAAWTVWSEAIFDVDLSTPIARALAYLEKKQRADGAWVPLWFGNQAVPGQENPVYGTARVMQSLRGIAGQESLTARGEHYLISAQNTDGGWGGAIGCPSSIEETALTLEALDGADVGADLIERGLAWLQENTDAGSATPSAPIGLYFAKLWYSEQLYPLIFSTAAVARI